MPKGGARHWKCCSGDPFLYLFEAIAVPEQTKPIPDMLDLRRNLTRLGVEARGRQNLAVKNLTRVGNSKKAATFRALDRET